MTLTFYILGGIGLALICFGLGFVVGYGKMQQTTNELEKFSIEYRKALYESSMYAWGIKRSSHLFETGMFFLSGKTQEDTKKGIEYIFQGSGLMTETLKAIEEYKGKVEDEEHKLDRTSEDN